MRYAIVGGLSNLLLLALFAVALDANIAPTTAALFLYAVGVVGTYLFNRTWSFSSRRRHSASSWRYVLVHLLGVATVIALHWVFHYGLGVPATLVQVAAMVLTAGMIFCLLEWVVFPTDNARAKGSCDAEKSCGGDDVEVSARIDN